MKYSRGSLASAFVVAVVSLLLAPTLAQAAPAHWVNDVKYFSSPSVTVYVDWKSFADHGVSPTLLDPLSRIVQGAAKRWNEVGRANVRLTWGGRSDGRVPASQEVVVRMVTCKNDVKEAIASAASAGSGKGKYVTLYQTIDATTSDGLPCSAPQPISWSFVFYGGSGRNVFGVTMHELGHALGLREHTPTHATRYSAMTDDGQERWPQSFGPWPDDIARLQALYGLPTSAEKIVVRKFTGQSVWPIQRTLPAADFGNTTLPIGAVREGSRITFAYTVPMWNFVATGFGDLTTNTWTMLGSNFTDSAYGVSMERGASDYLMAYVEWTGDPVSGGTGPNCQIRLKRSVNRGRDWTAVSGFPASHSASTPELVYLGNNAWAIFYSYFGNSQQTLPATYTGSASQGNLVPTSPEYRPQFGRLVARVSTDNGTSWGPEITPAPDGTWPVIRSGALSFAPDAGFRITSEIEGHQLGTAGPVVSFSASGLSPAQGTSHFSWQSVRLGTAGQPIPWNIVTPYPMSWADGRDVVAQTFDDAGSIWVRIGPNNGGAFGNTSYVGFSRMSPSLTDDSTANVFYMFTTETVGN